MALHSLVKDARKRERTIEVVAGFVNQHGTIHALIRNDRGEQYRVSLFSDGRHQCRHEVNGKHEPCPSHGYRCYHVEAVAMVAILFCDEGIVEYANAPADLKYLYDENAEAYLAQQDKTYTQAIDEMYAELGATKQPVSSCESRMAALGFMRGSYHGMYGNVAS